ncbi:hypothetical protein PROFUN_00539 [Planoprotostelium fungivorum]|uniref:Homeobox domain-containing protein n=1 Tax=Planoprotostelium fungivorum TaxID=1890364 RepID=A0A2P6N137_9EUKA|nr:hypothetical protein PROFUN_00539 [Planoprotostelium fungivorum]
MPPIMTLHRQETLTADFIPHSTARDSLRQEQVQRKIRAIQSGDPICRDGSQLMAVELDEEWGAVHDDLVLLEQSVAADDSAAVLKHSESAAKRVNKTAQLKMSMKTLLIEMDGMCGSPSEINSTIGKEIFLCVDTNLPRRMDIRSWLCTPKFMSAGSFFIKKSTDLETQNWSEDNAPETTAEFISTALIEGHTHRRELDSYRCTTKSYIVTRISFFRSPVSSCKSTKRTTGNKQHNLASRQMHTNFRELSQHIDIADESCMEQDLMLVGNDPTRWPLLSRRQAASLPDDGRKKDSRATIEQTNVLVDAFRKNHRPSNVEYGRLAKETGMSERRIKTWFQNRRSKLNREKKRMSKEEEEECENTTVVETTYTTTETTVIVHNTRTVESEEKMRIDFVIDRQ